MVWKLKPRLKHLIAAAALLAGCSGSLPVARDEHDNDVSAVLIRARFSQPKGEIKEGRIFINLESDSQKYRLEAHPNETTLYEVRPGTYHLAPVRTSFGFKSKNIQLEINDHDVPLSFPDYFAENFPITLDAGSVMPIGVIEVKFVETTDPHKASVEVSMDDHTSTRKAMIEEVVQRIMSPQSSYDDRESMIQWAPALQQALFRNQSSHVEPN